MIMINNNEPDLGLTGYAKKYNAGIKLALEFFGVSLISKTGGSAGDIKVDAFSQVMKSMMPNVKEEQFFKFSVKLIELLNNKINECHEKGNPYQYYLGLHVDYHPEGFLGEAANFAGISDIVFPYKTSVFILPDAISVKEGYAAEPVLIKA